MAIELDESEQVSIPPSGKRLIFVDTDGTTKQLLSTGAKSSMGGGGAVSVDGVTIGGDGTVGDPLEVIAGLFGSDTLVQLPNSAAALKTVSEWISSYASNTAGSEQSQVEIKTLQGGAQVSAFRLLGNTEAYLPDYIGFSQDIDTGVFRSAANTICMYAGGLQMAFFNSSGLLLNGAVGAQISWSGVAAGLYYSSATGMLRLSPTASANVDLGTAAGALATTATSGFPTMPTCAGAATGAATVTAGQAAFVYDSTNNKIYVRSGGTWRSTAALT